LEEDEKQRVAARNEFMCSARIAFCNGELRRKFDLKCYEELALARNMFIVTNAPDYS